MTWWMRSTSGRPLYAPETLCGLPQYKADAHRLFMAGRGDLLMRLLT